MSSMELRSSSHGGGHSSSNSSASVRVSATTEVDVNIQSSSSTSDGMSLLARAADLVGGDPPEHPTTTGLPEQADYQNSSSSSSSDRSSAVALETLLPVYILRPPHLQSRLRVRQLVHAHLLRVMSHLNRPPPLSLHPSSHRMDHFLLAPIQDQGLPLPPVVDAQRKQT